MTIRMGKQHAVIGDCQAALEPGVCLAPSVIGDCQAAATMSVANILAGSGMLVCEQSIPSLTW